MALWQTVSSYKISEKFEVASDDNIKLQLNIIRLLITLIKIWKYSKKIHMYPVLIQKQITENPVKFLPRIPL